MLNYAYLVTNKTVGEGDPMNNEFKIEQVTDQKRGLTHLEVQERIHQNLDNKQPDKISKSYQAIIKDNVFTLFNLINAILAAFIISIGSWRNLLFIFVILSNIIIGIIQEVRAKRVLDRLSLITQGKVKVLREGQWEEIHLSEVVMDDLVQLMTSNQIVADAIVVNGKIEVNESLVTGESDVIVKEQGSVLYSGSFVVSGSALCQVVHVGSNNYAQTIMKDAKRFEKHQSQLRDSINAIIKMVAIMIVPVGVLLFCKTYFLNDYTYAQSIVSTAAALIGMIPEGLVLLTSVALAVGTINLTKKKTLVQELYCIETLARVDMLCLDKTGTITEGNMQVEKIITLDESFDIKNLLANFYHALDDENATSCAIRNYVNDPKEVENAIEVLPFSSSRKCSAVTFEKVGTLILGAYEFITDNPDSSLVSSISQQANQGNRVLTLMHSSKPIEKDHFDKQAKPIALVLLSDPIRKEAPQTLEYFLNQGVTVKVISGDDPRTVHAIAQKANLKNYDQFIDMSQVSEEDIPSVMQQYTVFGRVSPIQKKLMILALKKLGHTTAMIGDGANDVMALKAADCSISVASGSEAAKNIANLVLLDNNFAHMPAIVDEGRRVINNIQRTSSLFLVKTTFSILLSILTLFLLSKYPFQPIQLTLISSLCIGIPSFFLALEPNYARVEGNFLLNVISKAIPGAICVVLSVLYVNALAQIIIINEAQITTMIMMLTATSSLIILYRVCVPFTLLRKIIFVSVLVGMIVAFIFLPSLFFFEKITWIQLIFTIVAMIVIPFLMTLLSKGMLKLKKKFEK